MFKKSFDIFFVDPGAEKNDQKKSYKRKYNRKFDVNVFLTEKPKKNIY